jgi:hypothetical protein
VVYYVFFTNYSSMFSVLSLCCSVVLCVVVLYYDFDYYNIIQYLLLVLILLFIFIVVIIYVCCARILWLLHDGRSWLWWATDQATSACFWECFFRRLSAKWDWGAVGGGGVRGSPRGLGGPEILLYIQTPSLVDNPALPLPNTHTHTHTLLCLVYVITLPLPLRAHQLIMY